MLYRSLVINSRFTTLKIHGVSKKEAIQLKSMGLSFTKHNCNLKKIYIENKTTQKVKKKTN